MEDARPPTRADAFDESGPQPPTTRGVEPLDLLALVSVVGAMVVVIGPIDDINDVFWHVLIGREILDGVPFAELGSGFSSSVQNDAWRTGAWGSETIMALLHQVGGWPALLLTLRLSAILGVAAVLWWGVLYRFPSRASVIPFVLAMAAMAVAVQERPQSFSFVLITLSGVWWLRSVVDGWVPRWWLVALVTIVWTNLHGLWVLLPVVLVLALGGRLLDHGTRDRVARELALVTAVSALCGLISPLGFGGWLLPFKLQSAGGVIVEWQSTELFDGVGCILFVVGSAVLILLGRVWRPSWGVYGVAVFAFGLLAVRNVTPAILLLSPLLAALLSEWLGGRSGTAVSQKERRHLMGAAGALAVTGCLVILGTVLAREHGPSDDVPVGAIETLREVDRPIRLLNEYNWAGSALFYGPDDLRVSIDGRADYYGGDYITQYQAALHGEALDDLVDEVDPTHALLRPGTAATTILELQGWTVLEASDDHVLLAAP